MTVNSSLAAEARCGSQLAPSRQMSSKNVLGGTSSTLPHQLTGISPNPPVCNFFFCSSRSASEFSTRWIEVTGGEECFGSDLKVCKHKRVQFAFPVQLQRFCTYAQDVGEQSTATRTELNDPHALRGALCCPLRDVPDGKKLWVVEGKSRSNAAEGLHEAHLSKYL